MNLKIIYKTVAVAACGVLGFLPAMAQNTAATSGNWNACPTWGTPTAGITKGNDAASAKTINAGVTVTMNTNWNVLSVALGAGGVLGFASSANALDLNTAGGTAQTCGPAHGTLITDDNFYSGGSTNGWSLGGCANFGYGQDGNHPGNTYMVLNNGDNCAGGTAFKTQAGLQAGVAYDVYVTVGSGGTGNSSATFSINSASYQISNMSTFTTYTYSFTATSSSANFKFTDNGNTYKSDGLVSEVKVVVH